VTGDRSGWTPTALYALIVTLTDAQAKRLDDTAANVRDLSQQLTNQAGVFIPRIETEARLRAQEEKIANNTTAIVASVSREEADRRIGLLDEKISGAMPRGEAEARSASLLARQDGLQRGIDVLGSTLTQLTSSIKDQASFEDGSRHLTDRRRLLIFSVLTAVIAIISVVGLFIGLHDRAKAPTPAPAVTTTTTGGQR
jgi:hypothetical protein